eukprot:1158487-Pelagomonas_calceolata.AAC.2
MSEKCHRTSDTALCYPSARYVMSHISQLQSFFAACKVPRARMSVRPKLDEAFNPFLLAAPRCGEVLIRNRERRIFCVRCDAYVASPQERQSMGVQMPHTPPLQPASPAATAEVQEEADAMLPAPSVVAPQGSPLVSLQQTLLGKATEIEAMISVTPASDITKCGGLMALLRDVLQTLKIVNEMHSFH